MIISLSGWSRAGKDSIGQYLVDHWGFTRRALADPIRAVMVEMDLYLSDGQKLNPLLEAYGWDWVKSNYYEAVEWMIGIGNGMRKHVGPDVWIPAMFKEPMPENIVVTDVRYPNEYDAMKAAGSQMWRVNRAGTSPRGMDSFLDDHSFDSIIINNGTLEELASQVDHQLYLAKFTSAE